ncbi:MAG TPA: 50S ribosomal protein L25 [bacterium]|nr:50S ribosomal protein L25 [bacterium]
MQMLTANLREKKSKGDAGRLRRSGKIPAVIYGHTDPQSVYVDAHEFSLKFHTLSESTIIRLAVGDKSHEVLIRDFQESILTGEIQHLDFYEIEKGKLLKTNVAVYLVGTAIGMREGGLLETFVHEVEVECLPKDLPPKMEIDISELQIGDSIHISEMPVLEGVRFLNSPDQVVCTVAHRAIEVEEEELEEEELLGEEEEETEDTEEA